MKRKMIIRSMHHKYITYCIIYYMYTLSILEIIINLKIVNLKAINLMRSLMNEK